MRRNIQYTLRNIKRNKVNTVITTVGLSIALASVLIIYLFVTQEKSYNSFHENADRIFRLNYRIVLKDGTTGADHLIDPDLAKELSDKVPQIEHCTPFRIGYMAQLDLEDKNLKVKLGIAEQEFFDMFSFKLIYGDRDNLLKNPTNIAITQSLAEKLAGEYNKDIENLIGQNLKFTFIEKTLFTIVGIMEDIPKNSSIDFEAIIPYEYEGSFWQSNNGFGNSSLFFEIKEDVNPQQANVLISNTVKEYYKKNIERAQKSNFLHPSSKCFQPFMLPLKSLYLDNSVDVSYELSGNKTQLKILTTVSILILFIAFSNYIILIIGQFFKKASEVSIRKSVGGGNIDILRLFLSENAILIVASFIMGGILSYVLIPVFNNISQSQIYFNLVNIPSLFGFSFFTIILLIALTSIIPMFIFRKVKPTLLAVRNLSAGKKVSISHLFVGLQYALAIVLIISTLVINKQTNYLKNKSLGFSAENIISIDVPYLNQSESAVLRDILKKQAGVLNTCLTNRNFFDGYSSRSFEVSNTEVMETYIFKADNYFISTLNLNLLEGRNFSESDISQNNRSIIVNEEFVSRMNFKDSPVGKTVTSGRDKFNIIGVVNDYQFLTSREKIQPMVLYSNTRIGNDYSAVLLKFNPQNLNNVISAIKQAWKEIDTKEELNYMLWDQELKSRYETEERLSKIIMYASIIAVVILSLGLFGLTVLISAQRINEIGIRKVNGAKVSEVLMLLNSDYLKWVFIALIVACPLAWHLLNKWLENFAYKTEIGWLIFAMAGAIALVIALLTVSWQSWRAARRNPVEALRYE